MQVSLANEFISFPKTDELYPVSYFTPKASFQHKNVCTDKSKLIKSKPNMVTCSFGINMYTTRCFNWISVGVRDEYVFIKKDGNYTAVPSYGSGEDTSNMRAIFDNATLEKVYNRIIGRFPADNTLFTSHKCIINKFPTVSEPTVITYIVGSALKDGTPDFAHCSDEQTFTLYPNTYIPRIYHITDQQGFHWIEYQAWAAAAKELDSKIKEDQKTANIIPVLINTGDMTQNGTRINEWLDYYNAGYVLFNHMEQMNVVGNNDLCGTNPYVLGTGDDIGKSNSFYFHLFYCYEVDENILPIVNGKYIPSLYYFDSSNYRFVMANSELTYENCKSWFKLVNAQGTVTNIYTGFTVPKAGETQVYDNSFTSVYTMLYNITDTSKKLIVACHELTYTVITRDSLKDDQKTVARSISNKNKLVGSHMNQKDVADNKKGIYWFSRLMEYRQVEVVLGGHKHTYECTYPVREYYYYANGEKNSLDNGFMTMQPTLELDDATWVGPDGENLTKFPLTKRNDVGAGDTSGFYPYTPVADLVGGITYFMCQATGYKLTSNKELPSPDQKFSIIIPKTGQKPDLSDKPDANQKHPMFAVYDLSNGVNIKLARIRNILADDSSFTQHSYGVKDMALEYLKQNNTNNYGYWDSTEANIIEL